MLSEDLYHQAALKLGAFDSRKECQWWIAFTRSDLSTLGQDEREMVRYCLLNMASRGSLRFSKDAEPDLESGAGWTEWGEDAPLPSWEDVLRLHQFSRGVLEDLVHGGHVTFRLQPIDVEIQVSREKGKSSVLLGLDCQGKRQDGGDTFFNLRLVELLAKHGAAIRACECCETLYLGRRVDQVFCSPKCLNREMQRRKRVKDKAKRQQRLARIGKRKVKAASQRRKGGRTHGTKRRQGSRHR